MMKWAEYFAVAAGFHTTVLPIGAGALGIFPAMAVKLNGVTANTKPSRGGSPRGSTRLTENEAAVRGCERETRRSNARSR